MQKKKWLPIALVLYIAQLLLEGYAIYRIIDLNMLPAKYLVPVLAVLIFLAAFNGLLFFLGINRKKNNLLRTLRRLLAVILAVSISLGSVYVAMVVSKVDSTVSNVTRTETTLEAMVGVYVMADDSAQSIEDAATYSFGTMSGFDDENTEYAVNAINETLGTTITTVAQTSMTSVVDVLYIGTVKAIILNEAYASTVSDFEGYENFETETRLIYEVPVEKTVVVNEDGTTTETDENDTDSFLDSVEAIADITSEPFVVYVSGSDTRSEILDRSRSDVNILMAVNPTTKQILLLNTPRDYYVANPAGDGAMDKLTHCGLYGVETSMEALANLYDTDVNYYGQINFTGFETLIDAIGGITVYSPQAFDTGEYSYVEGENTLDGAAALAFARERYAFASGDNMRGQNQMRVITAVINKMTSSGSTLLMNYSSILESLEGMFSTNLSSDEIAALVKMQLGDMASWNIKSYAVTGEGGSETTYSAPGNYAYVMYQDADMVAHASELLDKVANGETLTDADVATS